MHALAFQLAAERFAKLRQPTLDPGVGCVEWRGDECDTRRDVDNETIAARPQFWQRRASQQDRSQQVNLDHGPYLGFGCILQPAGPNSARVVDQDVETAELVQRKFERRFPALLGADVRGNEVNPPVTICVPLANMASAIAN